MRESTNPDIIYGFSRGRSGGLVFPSLSEFSTVYCDPHSQGFGRVNKAEIDVFLAECIAAESREGLFCQQGFGELEPCAASGVPQNTYCVQ